MTGLKEESFCPLGSKCVEAKGDVIHRCAWHVMVRGMDPNTGKEIDHWACAMAWMPTLLIENSQQQRQTGAAVESFRNEVVKDNQKLVAAMAIQSTRPELVDLN